MTFATLRRSSALLLGTTIAACGDALSGTDGSLSLSAANAITVAVGQSSPPIQLQLSRVSTTAAVTLSAEGLPTGVTATFIPSTLTNAITTATLSLAVAGTATPGTSNIIVKATGGGLSTQATVPVLVHPRPELSLTLDSANVRVLIADVAETTLSIGRTLGLLGDVQLSFGGMPDGISAGYMQLGDNGIPTGGINPALPPTAARARVMLGATATVTPGTYPITITASSPGVADKVVTLNLVVVRSEGGISMSIAPSPVAIAHGGSAFVRITVRRTAPFAGSVWVMPPQNGGGFTYAVQRGTIPPADSTADIVVLVTSAAGSGTRNITFTAGASGLLPITGTLAVTTTP